MLSQHLNICVTYFNFNIPPTYSALLVQLID